MGNSSHTIPDVKSDSDKPDDIPPVVFKPEPSPLPSKSENGEKHTHETPGSASNSCELPRTYSDSTVKPISKDTVRSDSKSVVKHDSDVNDTGLESVSSSKVDKEKVVYDDDVTVINSTDSKTIISNTDNATKTSCGEKNSECFEKVSNSVPKLPVSVVPSDSSLLGISSNMGIQQTETKPLTSELSLKPAPLTVLVTRTQPVSIATSVTSPKTAKAGYTTDRQVHASKHSTFTNEMFAHLTNYGGTEPHVFRQGLPAQIAGFLPKALGDVQTIAQGGAAIPHTGLKSQVLTQNALNAYHMNLLADLHKLSSPPNQQVFPQVDNQTGLSVASKAFTEYKHSIPEKKSLSAPTTPDKVKASFPPTLMSSELLEQKAAQLHELRLLSQKYDFDHQSALKLKPPINNFMDSDDPPPNVDVSQLKDRGHGLIPKDLIPSLCETEASISKPGLNVVSSSISLTSSSPRLDADKIGGIDKDVEEGGSEAARSDSACSDRLVSTAVSDKSTVNTNEKHNPDSAIVKASPNSSISAVTSCSASKASVEDQLSLSSKKGVNLTVTTAALSKHVDSIVNTTVPTPPTPTTVVHHTPGTVSCHQMSLSKAKQQINASKPASKKSFDLLTDASIINPLLAILSDPTISQAFKQMFPEVMQETLVHSIDLQSKLASFASTSVNNPPVSTARKTASSLQAVNPNQLPGPPVGSLSSLSNITFTPDATGSCPRPSFPVQEMISTLARGEFPASNLLSAAAKAQFTQPQNQLRFWLNQHGSLAGMVQNAVQQMNLNTQTPRSVPSGPGPMSTPQGSVVNLTTAAVPGQPRQGIVSNEKDGHIDKVKTTKGPSKISELLSRSAATKMDHAVSGPNVPFTPGFQIPVTQPVNHANNFTSGLPANTMTLPDLESVHRAASHISGQLPITSIGHLSSIAQPLTNFQEQIKNSNPGQINQHLLQMYSALGTAYQGVNSNPAPLHGNGKDTNTPGLSPGGIPNVVQSVASNNYKLPTQNISLPYYLQQQQHNLGNIPPIQVQDIQQQMLSLLTSQGINPAMLNLPLNQAGQVGLGQGGSQASLAQRPPIPQMLLAGHSMDIQNLVRPHSQANLITNNSTSDSSGNPFLPMNVINVQQSFGNGGPNLAMQLQTLQLQQQLLQQVQGMQHLINQFNIQGMVSGIEVSSKQPNVSSTMSVAPALSALNLTKVSASAPTVNIQSVEADRRRTSSENMISSSDGTVYANSQTVSQPNVSFDRKKYSRVIAAADTTAECSSSTKTVDIGIETESVEGDRSNDISESSYRPQNEESGDVSNREDADESEVDDESDMDENVFDQNDSCNQNASLLSEKQMHEKEKKFISAKQVDTHETDNIESTMKYEKAKSSKYNSASDAQTVPDTKVAEPIELKETKVVDVSGISSSKTAETSKLDTITTQYKPGTTCLAIATEKGNNRSRKSEFKSLKQKSSLAKSQNLAAELSTPSDGELKLRISRKHVLATNLSEVVSKKKRKREKSSQEKTVVTFEKKELRSSTQAATKASSMLAASSFQDSKLPKSEKESDVMESSGIKEEIQFNEPGESNTPEKVIKFTRSKGNIEGDCDSSMGETNELDSVDEADKLTTFNKQEDIKGTIVAALSCQKGQWSLGSGKKKGNSSTVRESQPLEDVTVVGKGLKRNRDENEGRNFLLSVFTFYMLA